MKLLIISYIYAPDRSPRAYRWAAIAEHWAQQGHHVDVLSGWKNGDAPHETMGGVRVWRVGNGLMEGLRGLLGQRSHGSAEIAQPRAAKGNGARRMLLRFAKGLYDATWKRLYWPDYSCLWFFPARKRALELCRTEGYDAVITVSHPFTGHLVGLAIKAAFAKLRWITDIGDPFSLLHEIPLNNAALYRRLNHRAEARILEYADAVAVTVESCRSAYADAFPGSEVKTVVVPPLLSLPPVEIDASSTLLGPGQHLVFVGTLYKSLRNPEPLLRLFAALLRTSENLHLHFFGPVNDCAHCFDDYNQLLGKNLHLHGTVPRAEAAQAMAEANLLVNIGNSTAHQLPSKIVEYVSMRRPILNLVCTAGDTSIPFLAEYPAAVSVVMEPNAPQKTDVAKVLALINTPPTIDGPSVAAFLGRYRLENIADSYLALAGGKWT